AKTAPTSAPRAISRIGSTWGAWRASGLGSGKVAAARHRLWRRQERVGPPGKPIGEQAYPLPRSDIHPPHTLRDLVERAREIGASPRPVIHGPGVHVEACLTEGGDRA